jgi:hypothetical protein
MKLDPSVNVVVFEVRRGLKMDKLVGEGRTRDPNCISAVWSELQRKHVVKASKVRRVYSEWQPSAEDAAFLKGQFPADLKVTYSFERPADQQWDKAFAAARQTMLQATAPDAGQAATSEKEGVAPLPVLRDLDGLSPAIAHRTIAPGLGVFLAEVGTTPRGTIGIDYVMAAKLNEPSSDAGRLWQQAFSNLASSLQVDAADLDGQLLFIFNREQGMAASAIALPDFSDRAAEWTGSQRLMVGIPDPDTLLLCAAGSPVVGHIQEATLGSQYVGAVNLTPCLLLLDHGRLSLEARRRGAQ